MILILPLGIHIKDRGQTWQMENDLLLNAESRFVF